MTGAVIACLLFSTFSFNIDAFEISVKLLLFGSGETVLMLPPVGQLKAITHYFPFVLQITLLNVNLDLLIAGLENLADKQNLIYFGEQIRLQLTYFILRIAAAVFLMSSAAVFLLTRERRWKMVILGGIIPAVIFIALIMTTLVMPYDLDAFENPEYEGIISAAPWIVNLTDQTLATIKTLGEQLEVMTGNLHDLSRQLEQVRPAHLGSDLRVLHVSDIHNNPAGVDFIEQVVNSFDIDLIIDTGDLTDYGTDLETELVGKIFALDVPYVFVPGNHDSPRVAEAMRREGAIVLEKDIIEIDGLRIAGVADPSSNTVMMEIAPDSVLRELGASAYRELSDEQPDLVATHNPRVVQPFVGKVPLILSGHTHRAGIEFKEGTVMIDAGSTGAAGMRGLQSPNDNPYSMVVIYFTAGEEGKMEMIMADMLSVQQRQDSFSLKRYYNQ